MAGSLQAGVGLQETFFKPFNPSDQSVAASAPTVLPPVIVARARVSWSGAVPRRSRTPGRAAWMDDDDGQWIPAPTRRSTSARSVWRRVRAAPFPFQVVSAPVNPDFTAWPRRARTTWVVRSRGRASPPASLVPPSAPSNPDFVGWARRPQVRAQPPRRQRPMVPVFGLPSVIPVLPRKAMRAWTRRAAYVLVPTPAQFNPPWLPGPAKRPSTTRAYQRRSRAPTIPGDVPTIPVGLRRRASLGLPRRTRFQLPPFLQPVVLNPDFTAWGRRARAAWVPRTRARSVLLPVPPQAAFAPNPAFTAWARRSRAFYPPRTRARTTPVPWGQAVAAGPPPWLPVPRTPRRWLAPRKRSTPWTALADVTLALPARRRIAQPVPRKRSQPLSGPVPGQLVPFAKRAVVARGPMLASRRRWGVLPVPAQVPPPPWVVPFYHRTLVWRYQLGRRTGRWRGWTPGQGSPLPPPTTLRFYVDDVEPNRALSSARQQGTLDDSEPVRSLVSNEPPANLSESEPSGGTTRVQGQ